MPLMGKSYITIMINQLQENNMLLINKYYKNKEILMILKLYKHYCFIIVAVLFSIIFIQQPIFAQTAEPELFNYQELVQLFEQEPISEPLQKKLTSLLTTPFVNNEAYKQGVRPLNPSSKKLGHYLRVVAWNIERGLELEAIKLAFTDSKKFALLIDKNTTPISTKNRKYVLQQIEILKKADVIILNEVDWGTKRTKYHNIVKELATTLNMNYAYGVEFVEVDPIALGIEKFENAQPDDKASLLENIKVDANQYKGLHGSAILSRYHLDNVQLIPFTHQEHDWYSDEKSGVAPFEIGKREAGEKVFLEKTVREVRRGGRMMLLADIASPNIPTGQATIVATHIESRTKPENRTKQLDEVLDKIKDIKHPVILAGDMNTSTKDATPTSILREIKKRFGSEEFWAKQAFKYVTGVGLLLNVVTSGIKFSRTQADPTVRNIRFFSANPEAEFFNILEDFRFSDKGKFDFRGNSSRSIDKRSGKLSNSNQRARKGFETTYETSRTIGPIGKFKLDWIFVKPPFLNKSKAKNLSYLFAPHFGHTLTTLNYAIEDRISDHNPIVVDLPLNKPKDLATTRNKMEK